MKSSSNILPLSRSVHVRPER